jgi:hypothetical protein
MHCEACSGQQEHSSAYVYKYDVQLPEKERGTYVVFLLLQ